MPLRLGNSAGGLLASGEHAIAHRGDPCAGWHDEAYVCACGAVARGHHRLMLIHLCVPSECARSKPARLLRSAGGAMGLCASGQCRLLPRVLACPQEGRRAKAHRGHRSLRLLAGVYIGLFPSERDVGACADDRPCSRVATEVPAPPLSGGMTTVWPHQERSCGAGPLLRVHFAGRHTSC